MEAWEYAWLREERVEPTDAPVRLLTELRDLAAAWVDSLGPRAADKSILLVRAGSREKAQRIMGALLWVGFRLSVDASSGPVRGRMIRMLPIPVSIHVLHQRPFPKSRKELRDQMLHVFERVLKHWRWLDDRLGERLVPGP